MRLSVNFTLCATILSLASSSTIAVDVKQGKRLRAGGRNTMVVIDQEPSEAKKEDSMTKVDELDARVLIEDGSQEDDDEVYFEDEEDDDDEELQAFIDYVNALEKKGAINVEDEEEDDGDDDEVYFDDEIPGKRRRGLVGETKENDSLEEQTETSARALDGHYGYGGGVGAFCRATSDCDGDLNCKENYCVFVGGGHGYDDTSSGHHRGGNKCYYYHGYKRCYYHQHNRYHNHATHSYNDHGDTHSYSYNKPH